MEENITQKDYYYVKDDHDYDVYNLSENHREEWLRLVAEKQQARKVKGKAGLSTSRSLYFGTRRSTHSDVVSMITTTKPHVDKGYGPTWDGLDNGKIKLEPFKNAKYTSPLYDPMQLDVDEHLRKNKALWKEHVKFMRKLATQRNIRGGMEAKGAIELQRLWRGFRTRRWVKQNARRMKVQRRMKKSYLKIAMKIRFQQELEEHARRAEERREDAADKIAATFRMYMAKNCAKKERKMRLDEVRRWAATTIQTLARQRVARRALAKKVHRVVEDTLRRTVILIQSQYRRKRDYRKVLCRRIRLERIAAIWIQRWYRRLLSAKVLKKARKRNKESVRVDAALIIQGFWRGIQARREAYLRRHKEEAEMLEAATLFIQRSFRGYLGRKRCKDKRDQQNFEKKLNAVIQIQRTMRGFLGRELFQDEIDRQESDIWRKIKDGNVTQVEDLFKGFGTDTIYTSDSVDPDGNTILCAAARWGHKRIVRRALKWHCELNHYNDDGMTAVELAVIHSHESVAEYLIEKDAELTMFGRTLLHEAAQRKMNNLATALLQRGVPVNSLDSDKMTALHEACTVGAWNMSRMLIDRGASIDATTEKNGQTALHMAAEKGHLRLVGLLMEAGARIDIKDQEGRTPWRTALAFNQKACAQMLRKARQGQIDVEAAELEAEATSMSDDQKDEVLSNARRGDIQAVTDALENGCPINVQGSGGESLLMAAASSGNKKLIEFLIRKGVSMKTVDMQEQNCLFYTTDSYEIGVMLAGRGADLMHKDLTGTTALHALARNGIVFTDIVKSLRINVNVKDSNGRLPIHSAAIGAEGDACRALISLGADVNAVDDDNATPLHLAAEADEAIMAINALCEGNAKVNVTDNDGRIPMHRAAVGGIVSNIIAISEATAGHLGFDMKDKDGNTPLHLATANGYLQVVRAMFSKGAKMDMRNNEDLDIFATALKSGDKCLKVIQFLIKKDLGTTKARYGSFKRTPLHYAVLGNSEMVILALLDIIGNRKSKALVKFINIADTNGETAFVTACKNGCTNAVKTLIGNKADIHVNKMVDSEKMRTCLHIACSLKNTDEPDLLRLLCHAGYDLGKPDGSSSSCIHIAADQGHADIIEAIVQLGIVPDLKDGNGRTALHIASGKGRLRACKMLVKNGARIDIMDNDGQTAMDHANAANQKSVIKWLNQQ
jgi:ankyrin repeat protein